MDAAAISAQAVSFSRAWAGFVTQNVRPQRSVPQHVYLNDERKGSRT